ncbi:hypothetical protein GCM10007876_31640 [Litoribrevibacter albus]|uniref:Uncharacterized protein n=2 Tax=Litoribrevibacter albus TaxID=1473156 RepID=A0AA37SB55_9GAMM|nr:hypothetical protein GCM10007876_31640 [Litoribrevibacter albus]
MPHYNVRSERSLINIFPRLEPVTELNGVYLAELPGPKILTPFKRLFLSVSGLPGWKGKQFFGDYALNILSKKGQIYKGPEMRIQTQPHKLDGKQGAIATYDSTAPHIWQHCTDEFRQIDQDTVLGMSHFDLPAFRGRPVMFLLHRLPDVQGLV